MNEEVIRLTKSLGDIHIKIAKLNAEKHVIQERIWAEKAKSFLPTKKGVKKNGVKKSNKSISKS